MRRRKKSAPSRRSVFYNCFILQFLTIGNIILIGREEKMEAQHNLPKTNQQVSRKASTLPGLDALSSWVTYKPCTHTLQPAFGPSHITSQAPYALGILSFPSPATPCQTSFHTSAQFLCLESPPLMVHMVTLTQPLSFCSSVFSSEKLFL